MPAETKQAEARSIRSMGAAGTRRVGAYLCRE